MRAWYSSVACVACLTACSALIQPDPSRLGGGDGSVRLDSASGDGATGDGATGDGGVMHDSGPTCPPSCDDSVACTHDSCVSGSCAHTPDDAICATGERCNPVMGCVPFVCTTAAQCDDGQACNGNETCMPGSTTGSGCIAGTPPVCDDGLDCTTDSCSDAMHGCVHAPDNTVCDDGIDCTMDACDPASRTGCRHVGDDTLCNTLFCTTGSTCSATGCGGGVMRDCSDSTACTNDTCDETARVCTNTPRDDDADGYGPISVRSPGMATLCGGMDCDDTNMAVHPGAPEVCNAIDDNCNGTVDEGCTTLPDDCGSAQTITLSPGGTFSLAVPLPMLGSLRDDYSASTACMPGTGGRDAVYALDIVGRHDVVIDTIGSSVDTVLAVSGDCSADGFANQGICNDDIDTDAPNRASRIWLHRIGSTLTTTRVYILVDGFDSGETGSYQLNVHQTDAQPDGCATTRPLDISGGGTVGGFTTALIGNTHGTCEGDLSTNPEGVFRFTAPTSASVTFHAYSRDFTPDLYLRTDCGSGELDCVNGASIGGGLNSALLSSPVTSGATHYLFVDNGRTGGAYMLIYDPF